MPAAEPPSNRLRLADRPWVPWVAPAIALLLGVYHVARAETLDPDGVKFLRYARRLAGDWPEPRPVLETLAAEHQHPGYPALILAARGLLSPLLPEDPVAAWRWAGVSVNLAAGVALTFAAASLAGALIGRSAAIAAGLLVAVGPGFAPLRADVMSDPAGLALLCRSAAAAVRCLDRGSARQAAWAGLFGGLGYLVRPEEFQAAALLGGVLLWRAAAGGPGGRGRAMRCLLALAVPAAALMLPYMAIKGSPLTKKAHEVKAAQEPPLPRLTLPPQSENPLPAPSPEHKPQPPAAPAPSPQAPAPPQQTDPAPAATAAPTRPQRRHQAATGYARYALLTARPVGWVFVPHLLIGLWRRRRRVLGRAGEGLVWTAFAVNFLLLPLVLYVWLGYLNPRHVYPGSLLTLAYVWPGLMTAAGWVTRRPGRLAVAVLLTGCAGMAGWTLAHRLHPEHAGHRAAGEWLRERIAPGRGLVDPFLLAGYYADRDADNRWDGHPHWYSAYFDYLIGRNPEADWFVLSDVHLREYAREDRLPPTLGGRRLTEAATFPATADPADPRRVRVFRLEPAVTARPPAEAPPPAAAR
jgi:hypothetical protein